MFYAALVGRAIGFATIIIFAGYSQAASIHNEVVDGDLTDFVQVSPWRTSGEPIGSLSAGTNIVQGTFGTDSNNNRDSDVFTFHIPTDFQLTSLDLTYTLLEGSFGNGSYISINNGVDLGTGISTASQNLDDALVNTSGDLLSMFASGEFSGGLIGVSTPLTAGDYTIGLHETNAVISYTLAFNVSPVPEPSTWLLCVISILALAGLYGRLRLS